MTLCVSDKSILFVLLKDALYNCKKNNKVMALQIASVPVLSGEAADPFLTSEWLSVRRNAAALISLLFSTEEQERE